MAFSAETEAADIRVRTVGFGEHGAVGGPDGWQDYRGAVAWYPRLAAATAQQRSNWQPVGAGYGIHWPDVDEDVDTAGLLLGQRAPEGSQHWRSKVRMAG